MENCIFCKIIKSEIPSQKVFENENVLGFKDLHPQAKTHLLFIHKSHSENLNQMTKQNPNSVLELIEGICEYTKNENLDEKGYRLVTNIGKAAGQSVFHTHFHVLSSSKLGHFGE